MAKSNSLLRVYIGVSDRPVVGRVIDAGSFWLRLRGLLGRTEPADDEGLLLRPCNAIHTFFLPYPIDAVFLDAEGTVLTVAESISPWRLFQVRGAASVLELRAGTARKRGLTEGTRVHWEFSSLK